MSIILATQESQIGGLRLEAGSGRRLETVPKKYLKQKRLGAWLKGRAPARQAQELVKPIGAVQGWNRRKHLM
jgi:hypothetical protein